MSSRRLARRDQRGVTGVLVAICTTALVGMAMLAIDGGILWSNRRDVITDTDAASLAAARLLATRGDAACSSVGDAEAEAEAVLAENDPNTEMELFEVGACSPEFGWVRVDARLASDPAFAGVAGFDRLEALSSSSAMWAPLLSALRVRPIALCSADHHYQEWLAFKSGAMDEATYNGLSGPDHPDYDAAGTTHRVFFEKVEETDCGDSSGNWGWLAFRGAPGGSSLLAEDLRNGYPGEISLDPHECSPETSATDCPGQTGAQGNALNSALASIRCPAGTAAASCTAFPIIVYDTVSGPGANALYHHVDFLGVVLRGYSRVTGTPRPDSYFDFEFVDLVWQGRLAPGGSSGALLGLALCGGNYGSTIDNRCEQP